jgi:hypothetical protein
VYADIVYGPYTLKCRFITEITHNPHLGNHWNQNPLRDWNVVFYFAIDEIHVSIEKLLQWRCGCSNPCSGETLFDWACPSLPSRRSAKQRRRPGPFWNYTNEKYWKGELRRVSRQCGLPLWSPLWTFLIPLEDLNKSLLFCSQCMGVEVSTWLPPKARRRINCASQRCARVICGACCPDMRCMGHHLCHGCRANRLDGGFRPCQLIYQGRACELRPRRLDALYHFNQLPLNN